MAFLTIQEFRRRIYSDLLAHVPVKVIVETGTFLGTTTSHFAQSGLPVYSVETNPRFFAYSELRFRREKLGVYLFEGDTLPFLRSLTNIAALKTARIFFYLDAHWYEHLPLREELEIIFAHWKDAVVMVDDFEVPGTSYTYDDYGPGKVLNMAYLDPLRHLRLSAFFPTLSSENETGLSRGCVVLASDHQTVEQIKQISTLRLSAL